MPHILSIDTAHIKAPDKPLTHRYDLIPPATPMPPAQPAINFEIHIPVATGGAQRWNYLANGYPIGQIYKYRDPGCGHDYCVKPINSERVWRFSTMAKADAFLKDTCR